MKGRKRIINERGISEQRVWPVVVICYKLRRKKIREEKKREGEGDLKRRRGRNGERRAKTERKNEKNVRKTTAMTSSSQPSPVTGDCLGSTVQYSIVQHVRSTTTTQKATNDGPGWGWGN